MACIAIRLDLYEVVPTSHRDGKIESVRSEENRLEWLMHGHSRFATSCNGVQCNMAPSAIDQSKRELQRDIYGNHRSATSTELYPIEYICTESSF